MSNTTENKDRQITVKLTVDQLMDARYTLNEACSRYAEMAKEDAEGGKDDLAEYWLLRERECRAAYKALAGAEYK